MSGLDATRRRGRPRNAADDGWPRVTHGGDAAQAKLYQGRAYEDDPRARAAGLGRLRQPAPPRRSLAGVPSGWA